MKKRFLCLILAVCVIVLMQLHTAMLASAETDVMKEVEIFEVAQNLNDAVYHYDLNDYFEKGEIKYTEYQLVSHHPKDMVSLEQNILIVTPSESFDGTVKVGAKNRDGEFDYILFRFQYVEPVAHMEGIVKITAFVLFLVLLLLVVAGVFLCPMKTGTITYKPLTDTGVLDHTNISSRYLPYVRTSSKVPIRGFFLGWNECIRFVPAKGQAVYIKDQVDNEEVVVRIKSYPIYYGKDNTAVFYTNKTCNEGVRIVFNIKS